MVGLQRVFRSKLLVPVFDEVIARPRLLEGVRTRILAAQAPAGAGKTVFLTQWLAARDGAAVYYQLDEQDGDGSVFAAHLQAGFQACWPGWAPPPEVADDPSALAVEVVNEAAGRGPVALVLDRLEAGFGRPYLADFLAIVVKYAPPSFALALGTRAPLPADLALPGRPIQTLTAADLAMTAEEAAAWLGTVGWEECHAASGGLPRALWLWRQSATTWRQDLTTHLLAEMPSHVASGAGRALVDAYVNGRIPLVAFAHQVSQGQPGAEQLWAEVQKMREMMQQGEAAAELRRLEPLWQEVRSSGNRELTGVTALLLGDAYYCLGEYGRALEWFRRAFEAEPLLETTGTHSVVTILKDLGQVVEAEALARRCVAALQTRGDMGALAYAHEQYGVVLIELGRFDEAEAHLLEAERVGLKLSGDPFYGILAMSQRARLAQARGDAAAHRRIAEEAYMLAKHRSPWLEAICGFILAPALLPWGEYQEAGRLVQQSLAFLTRMDSKWELHVIYAILARMERERGNMDQARQHIDRSLAMAAGEGYVQMLQGMQGTALPLVADALARGVEPSFCQEVLVRAGERSLPHLLELAARPDPEARRAALYPLARVGGEQAVAAIRHLLYDPDESVRDGALVAWRTLGQPEAAPSARVSAAPAEMVPAAERPETEPILQVAVLGPVEVAAAGEPVSGWRTVKARDLVAFLVLAGGRPVTRDQLIEALWPESDLEGGQALLHTTLYYLRRALKPAGEGLITFAGGAYRLDRERVAVDLDRFDQAAAAGGEANWREAARLYRGELLEGLDYPWAEAPRARVRAAYLEVLRSLAAALREAGRPGEAVEWLQRLIQADPLAEEGHVGLMECYAAIGNRNAALQQYRTLVRALDEELGLEPGEAAVKLYQRLLG